MKIDFRKPIPDEAAEPIGDESMAYLINMETGDVYSLGSLVIFSLGKMKKQDRNEKKEIYSLRKRIRRSMREKKAIDIEARELTMIEDSLDIYFNDISEPAKEYLQGLTKREEQRKEVEKNRLKEQDESKKKKEKAGSNSK